MAVLGGGACKGRARGQQALLNKCATIAVHKNARVVTETLYPPSHMHAVCQTRASRVQLKQ
jgi:hypothetical protein